MNAHSSRDKYWVRTSQYSVIHGDCISEMRKLPDNSIDSIVTDPPYEIGFMSKSWDSSGIAYSVEMWSECLRVLKPGGYLLAFSSARTYHRMAVAIEDSGFQIRDQMMWLFGSGFPKSHDVSKGIDKLLGGKREIVGTVQACGYTVAKGVHGVQQVLTTEFAVTSDVPATVEAARFQGFGTALKPAHEPICMARKPLSESTIARNVLEWGTGALNIDACRIAGDSPSVERRKGNISTSTEPAKDSEAKGRIMRRGTAETYKTARSGELLGRFPANVLHDGSEAVVSLFPNVRTGKGSKHQNASNSVYGARGTDTTGELSANGGDDGSAARFFYNAKASRKDRDEGLDAGGNIHATVKPTALMQHLVKLVTPPGGTVLDPFTGSGSTGKAAVLEGFDFLGFELDADYVAIARARIEAATKPS